MTEIRTSSRQGAPKDSEADTRIVGLWEGEKPSHPTLAKMAESEELSGKFKRLGIAHAHSDRIVTVGLGKREEFTTERARVAAAVAYTRISEISSRSVSWELPDQVPEGSSAGQVAQAIVEGTMLKAYKFDRYKSKPDEDDDEPALIDLEIVAEAADLAEAVERGRIITKSVNYARDLQNLPSNVATPSYLSDQAGMIVSECEDVSFRVNSRQDMERMGMGAFLAVAQGTPEEPGLIELRYHGKATRGPRLGIVGKAVTFDTGGISLKPSGKMQEMKFDMSGGAAALESIRAIAKLKLPIDVTAFVAATENMPSGTAMKPGDIVTASNGKTIEINNTDAEGRLVLADTLAYAVSEGVERIIDLATLTGAIIVALGSTYAGHFSNDDDWYEQVKHASDVTGELGHRLPLHPEYLELTKGKYADLTNAAESRKASSIYAAEFLRQFVDDVPWVHVDIAGTAWDMGREYVGKGASGFGVRMLVQLAQDLAGSEPRLSVVT